MNIWQVGDVTITRVIEMEITGGTRFILPQATPSAIEDMEWMVPHFATAEGKLIMSVHALVVDTPSQRIIVDTCIGNDKSRSIPTWSHLQLPFLADLEKAGYPRETIDTVLCTHLHVDHVGWNTMLVDGQWIPTFPNARYLIAKEEFEYWDREADPNDPDNIMDDSVRPIFEHGLADLVDLTHQICPEVRLEPTPGHTPGHVSIHIESQGQEALITGDCIHHPCQIEHLDWASNADFDQTASTQTREHLMNTYSDTDVLIIGTHFPTPTAGYIKHSERGYWLAT